MSKSILIGTLIGTCAQTLLVSCSHPIPSQSGWDAYAAATLNPVSGYVRVFDRRTNRTLFYYHNDQAMRPVALKRGEQGEWTVTFKPRESP
jgi:hypothetical protein